jgi:SSS family solute:Na+ symporter
MFLPAKDLNIPFTALIIGLWIPNFYYWGLNQYITQRILGSASLREGQKGIVFAAAMKLIVPFIIVIPGIIAFNLYSKDLAIAKERANQRVIAAEVADAKTVTVFKMTDTWQAAHPEQAAKITAHNTSVRARTEKVKEVEINTGYKFDASLNLLIKNLIPSGSGLVGFVLAALLGAIVSSLAAVLNAASTIFTMDIYQKHVSPNASQKGLVGVGRICVGVFAVIGCLVSPLLDKFGSIFAYIQEFQGFASPGILAVFVFGLLSRRAPGFTGVVGLLLNPVLYGILKFTATGLSFLDRMAVCFFAVMIVMTVIRYAKPLAQPVVFQTNTNLDLTTSSGSKTAGWIVIVLTLVLYVIFSPLGLAK